MKRIKVLIVDGSSSFRDLLSRVLRSDASIEVIGTAADPFAAAGKMAVQIPDVITTDIAMEKMNGLVFLKKIMAQHPIPVVVLSKEVRNKQLAEKAIEYGAVQTLSKDVLEHKDLTAELKAKVCSVIKEAAQVKVKKKVSVHVKSEPKLSADAVLHHVKQEVIPPTERVIVLGASTGGTEAIRAFLKALPSNAPGIVIVQHMPEHFTFSFAARLNDLCKLEVKEAANGDKVTSGRALIAPGNRHMLLKKKGLHYYVEITDGPLVNRHRPSVDVLFRSAAMYAGRNSIGVLLTGMGSDGAKGLLEMRQAGALTIAQDEKSSVVFGMPKEAIQLNAAVKILPLQDIAKYVVQKNLVV